MNSSICTYHFIITHMLLWLHINQHNSGTSIHSEKQESNIQLQVISFYTHIVIGKSSRMRIMYSIAAVSIVLVIMSSGFSISCAGMYVAPLLLHN
jgi:hypothetical protein